MSNFIFFGDSICCGQGISLHKSWVVNVSKFIESEVHSKHDITIINSSKNGDTTRLALERMPFDVQSHGAKYMVVQFGINDANYWQTDNGIPRVHPMAFEANIYEIISRAKTFGAEKIILNTNHLAEKYDTFPNTDINLHDSCKNYNEIIRKVGSYFKGDQGVLLNDVENIINNYLKRNEVAPSNLLLPDGVHLSELGHHVYSDLMIQAVQDFILKDLQ